MSSLTYILVERRNADELSADVTRLLADGWTLYGNPFADEGCQLYQAMIKAAQA